MTKKWIVPVGAKYWPVSIHPEHIDEFERGWWWGSNNTIVGSEPETVQIECTFTVKDIQHKFSFHLANTVKNILVKRGVWNYDSILFRIPKNNRGIIWIAVPTSDIEKKL